MMMVEGDGAAAQEGDGPQARRAARRAARDAAWLEVWRERLRAARLVVVVQRFGLIAARQEGLRRALERGAARLVVVRNALARVALEGAPCEALRGALRGPCALVVSDAPVAALGALYGHLEGPFQAPVAVISRGHLRRGALAGWQLPLRENVAQAAQGHHLHRWRWSTRWPHLRPVAHEAVQALADLVRRPILEAEVARVVEAQAARRRARRSGTPFSRLDARPGFHVEVKLGVIDGRVYSAQALREVAALPSRAGMRARLLGMLRGSAGQLVGALEVRARGGRARG